MKRLVKGAHVFQEGRLIKQDVLVDEATGRIEVTAAELSEDTAEEVIDAEGLILSPGFTDLHIHLREPGGEAKETIASGTAAAAKGGFTTVCAMPNTRPVPDHQASMEKLLHKIREDALIHVLPYAAITERQAGRTIVDMDTLHPYACAFTDDGVGVQEAGTMFAAMKKAASLGAVITAHCEDNSLLYQGVMHDGSRAGELGLPGIASVSESVHIARDVLLAEAAGCHYHVCHVSTKESVRVIRDAKRAGIHVTAEVTPHHLLLNEQDIPADEGNYKMNPPLRAKEDQMALIEGLLDGTIDVIATDHAPHTKEEKERSMLEAPFGITGLETAFPLLYTHLCQRGVLQVEELLHWLTDRPNRLFGLPERKIEQGAPADLVLLDTKKSGIVDTAEHASKGTNTPFDGWTLQGWPVLTMCGSKVVYREERER
ncbi:dihydroorotase [Alkalicoccus chagannorensis]|uniref:dihydroorotase n=1 Tax=Alkalicoccus chagannorensis TaxID=427072 RepID=UPI00054E9876|nr:dihydroorotase [Alkalicoccus chagannorensis]